MKRLVFWVTVLGSVVGLDYWLDRTKPEMTLSHTLRDYGRLEHPAGEVAFLAGWFWLTSWFLPHMIRPARMSRRLRRALAHG